MLTLMKEVPSKSRPAATTRVHTMHCSMQFNDTSAQKRHDVTKIFVRASRRKVLWITGTEAGEEPLKSILKAAAKKYGYYIHFYRSRWLAVRKADVKPGTYKTGDVFVVDNAKTVGHGHDPGFCWASFIHIKPELGKFNVAAGHYPTKGRTPRDPNHKYNRMFAIKVGTWMRKAGKGTALAFFNGDLNMPDNSKIDSFFGEPVTSTWDELKHYENTGHGVIDVTASYDGDARVHAAYVRALNDKEMFLHTDHFPVESGYDIGHIKVKGA